MKLMSSKAYINQNGIQCPKCRKKAVEAIRPEIGDMAAYSDATCTACKATWTDIYILTGFEDFEEVDKIEEKINETFG